MVVAFFVCAALIVYTYAGYPLFIAVLGRLRRFSPKSDTSFLPKVSVCVANFNGCDLIEPKLETLRAQDYSGEVEYLFFDDGSTDGSLETLRGVSDSSMTVLFSEENQGKPSALNAMAAAATGEVLFLTDMRQRLSPNAISSLVAVLADERVGCVTGLLQLEGKQGASAYWKYETWIRKSESSFRGIPGVTGAIYATRKETFPNVVTSMILDDMYVPLTVGKHVYLERSAIAWDQAADDSREFVRKVRTLAGNVQLFVRKPWWLLPFAHRNWLELFSHKLCRLLCPWAILGMVALAILLVGTGWNFLAASSLTAVGLGALFVALGGVAGKLGRLARTFAVMNTAALLAPLMYFSGRARVTWNR